MGKPYFKPCQGKNYNTAKTLILSESAYSWRGDNRKIRKPSPSHPKESLVWGIDCFPKQRYFASMSRALCGVQTPTRDQMRRTWSDYAYTIYVQGTVGKGARKRPSPQQWEDAAHHFLDLLERIRPRKVIVTGLDMWKKYMPRTAVQRSDQLEAYQLSDGALVWCLALPHPSNTRQGFNWETIGERIRKFRATKLPLRR